MLKLRNLYRLLVGVTCGAMVLQSAGCVEVLVPSIVNLALSTLLSLLFGTPL